MGVDYFDVGTSDTKSTISPHRITVYFLIENTTDGRLPEGSSSYSVGIQVRMLTTFPIT